MGGLTGVLSWGAHGPNEYVPIDQVVAACKVYAGLIIDLCGQPMPEQA